MVLDPHGVPKGDGALLLIVSPRGLKPAARTRIAWASSEGRMPAVRVNVLFLGPAKDFANAESVSLEIAEATTVADLRGLLAERYEGLRKALGTIRFAVNEEFASDDVEIKAGDEVALIPPVSGG